MRLCHRNRQQSRCLIMRAEDELIVGLRNKVLVCFGIRGSWGRSAPLLPSLPMLLRSSSRVRIIPSSALVKCGCLQASLPPNSLSSEFPGDRFQVGDGRAMGVGAMGTPMGIWQKCHAFLSFPLLTSQSPSQPATQSPSAPGPWPLALGTHPGTPKRRQVAVPGASRAYPKIGTYPQLDQVLDPSLFSRCRHGNIDRSPLGGSVTK
jgi:hypothetical protein